MNPEQHSQRAQVVKSLRGPLHLFFEPASVAVIGATEAEGSVGRTILANLIRTSFPGSVIPVNPKRASVLGVRAYPNISSAPGPVDLAVIAIPARTVPGVIRECVDAGIKAAIIISAGFRETGREGLALEQEVLAEARHGGMRLIGPNCLGLMNPITGLNATFAASIALVMSRSSARAGPCARPYSTGAFGKTLASVHSCPPVPCSTWGGET